MSNSFKPMDYSLPGSSVHVFHRQRILEWLPFPSPGDLLDPGIEPKSPALAGGFFTTVPPGKPPDIFLDLFNHAPDFFNLTSNTEAGM